MSDKIKCPNCGHSFDVEEALSGKIEAHFKEEFEKKVAHQADIFNKEKKKLEEEREALILQKENQENLLKKEVTKLLEEEKKKIEKNTLEVFEEQIKSLTQENEKRKSENKTLKKKEVALLKQASELKEKEEELELQVEKQILERQKEIEDKARLKEREFGRLMKDGRYCVGGHNSELQCKEKNIIITVYYDGIYKYGERILKDEKDNIKSRVDFTNEHRKSVIF